MNIFKCTKCDHTVDTAGFCPKDGTQLSETKAEGGAGLEKLLSNIGDLVKAKTEETMKEYGFERGPQKKIFGSGKNMSMDERHEFVKGLFTEKDKSYFESISNENEQKAFLGKARCAYFFKNLVAFKVSGDQEYLQNVKALSEGDDGSGGYLTPREFRAELVRDIKDAPFLRNLVTVIPMSTDYLELPTLLSDVKTSWGSENTTISTTTARFGTLTFTPFRLNTFLYTSRELVADSAINIIQMITKLFVEAIGREEDRVIINGSNSGQPAGILYASLSGIDNANVDADLAGNIMKLPYRLGTAYRRNAKWLVNSISLGAVRSRQATDGKFIFSDGLNGEPGRLAGYPVFEQNDIPLDTMIFCDPTQYYLADREQISVESTTDGAGTFEKHQVAIKVIERIDGQVANVQGFKLLTNCGID